MNSGKEETQKYICKICGYIYDPVQDESTDHKEPLPFSKLPLDWVCPICCAGKVSFQKFE